MEKTENLEARVISQQVLYSDEHIDRFSQIGSLGFNNFITGIAEMPRSSNQGSKNEGFFGVQGNNSASWQGFSFIINVPTGTGQKISNAIASISLLGISNIDTATNMNYLFKDVTTSTDSAKAQVNVSGYVMIGDSDGFLGQLGYTCIVTYS